MPRANKVGFKNPSLIYETDGQAAPAPSGAGALPLTPQDLDALDDICEQTVDAFQPCKQAMLDQIDASYEATKRRLVALLDSVYARVYDLANGHSKYAKVQRLVEWFQDAKSDYELEATAVTAARLSQSTRSLLRFEDTSIHEGLVDDGSISAVIDSARKCFDYLLPSQLRESAAHKEFAKLCESKRVGDSHVRKMLRSNLDVLVRPEKPQGGESIAEQNCSAAPVLNQHPEVAPIKSKLCGNATNAPDPEKASIPNPDALIDMLNLQNRQQSASEKEVYWLAKDNAFLVSSLAAQNGFDKFSLLELKRIRHDNAIDDLASVNIPGVVRDVTISPSKRHVAVRRVERPSLLFRLTGAGLTRSPSLDPFRIRHAVFVRHNSIDKVLFVDRSSRLGVYDLDKDELECAVNYLRLRSVHYVNSECCLVLTESFEFGLLSLDTLSLGNLCPLDGFRNAPCLETQNQQETQGQNEMPLFGWRSLRKKSKKPQSQGNSQFIAEIKNTLANGVSVDINCTIDTDDHFLQLSLNFDKVSTTRFRRFLVFFGVEAVARSHRRKSLNLYFFEGQQIYLLEQDVLNVKTASFCIDVVDLTNQDDAFRPNQRRALFSSSRRTQPNSELYLNMLSFCRCDSNVSMQKIRLRKVAKQIKNETIYIGQQVQVCFLRSESNYMLFKTHQNWEYVRL